MVPIRSYDLEHYPNPDHIAIIAYNNNNSCIDYSWVGDLTNQHSGPQEQRAWNRGDQYSAAQLSNAKWRFYVWTEDATLQ